MAASLLSDERIGKIRETAFRYSMLGISRRVGQFEVADVLALLTKVRSLEERVATLRDLLERVQWGNTGACPECGRMSPTHAAGCDLAAALRDAGE